MHLELLVVVGAFGLLLKEIKSDAYADEGTPADAFTI